MADDAGTEDGLNASVVRPKIIRLLLFRLRIPSRLALGLTVLGLSLFPAIAKADPCEGRLPSRAGEAFSGQVRYIGDGDSLCVGRSSDPETWVEVRLSDFDAPELHGSGGRQARDRLSRLVMGRSLSCVAVRGATDASSSMTG